MTVNLSLLGGAGWQFLDNNGSPLSGGLLYTYQAGTALAANTYTSASGVTPNSNPVVLNAAGRVQGEIWLTQGQAYKFVLKTSTGVTLGTYDNVPGANDPTDIYASIYATLAASSGSSLIGYLPAGTGAVATTVQTKLRESVSVMDFGAVNDGTTDNTTTILNAVTSSGKKLFSVPYNVKYDRVSLLSSATFPADVVLFDLSAINDFNTLGETTKHVGIVSKDSAPNDTHWSIDSGHHSITTLNNFGTAGTTSASERKASLLWAAGQYTLGATNKRGFRGAAIQQFTKETGDSIWKWQIRSLAPWVSIAGQYEEWASGRVITGTTYVTSNSQQYVSASTGTTGATAPTWTSGTSSDGGVNWTWIDSGDRTLFQCDEYGRWIINTGNTGDATWNHKVGLTDPNGQYRFQGVSQGVSKVATFKLIPTNAGGTDSLQPYLMAQDGVGLRIMKSDGSTDVGYFSDTAFYGRKQFLTYINFVDTTNSATTAALDATGKSLVYVSNGGATNVTSIAGGTDGQYLTLVFTNANTTMVSSASLLMAGSINVTPTTYSVITLLKVPISLADRWIEVSRSIK